MNSRQDNINHSYLYLVEVANGPEVEISELLKFKKKKKESRIEFNLPVSLDYERGENVLQHSIKITLGVANACFYCHVRPNSTVPQKERFIGLIDFIYSNLICFDIIKRFPKFIG